MMEKLLEIVELTAGYDRGPVIRDITFSLKSGEFTVLVGPNASGKSTLLKAILRMNKIFRGKALFKGQDVSTIPRRKLAREIAYLPQENGHEFPFSLEEVVIMGRFPHNPLFFDTPLDREKTEEALRNVDLWEKRKERFATLSGGEKRRAVIARAIAQGSELFLLDEPTLHLDLNFQLEISSLLRKLAERGMAVLAVYHDLWLATLFAHRILAMKSGILLQEFSPKDVTPNFASQLYDLNLNLLPEDVHNYRGRFLW
ncbi:MAG: ABC transporter ATP-binding protein [Caldiserica bacterium]|jgi:iron complex transport system ATP-binding protein|nr:ABC transporter ATP-binding protein [Caldisericota bacterium]